MNAFKLRLFLLTKLPLAFIAGLRLKESGDQHAQISLRFSWWNQNPFRSIYFAALAMAAELSTGILILDRIQKSGKSFSFLVVGMKGDFTKKATGRITFECRQGQEVDDKITLAIADREGHQIELRSIGKNEQGDTVAMFTFYWSIKTRG